MGFYCNPQFILSSLLLSVLEALIVLYRRIVSPCNSSVVILHREKSFILGSFHHSMTTLECIIIQRWVWKL